MQQVFLSYTYQPHPDYVDDTEALRRAVATVIESMDLRVVTGEDVGGAALTDQIRKRIDSADALIALSTPWKDAAGNKVAPPWVNDEYTYAAAKSKPAIKVLHEDLAPAGMFAQNESIKYLPADATEVILKLIRTIALWKKQHGRPMEIELALSPSDANFDRRKVNSCEYQIFHEYKQGEWQNAVVWPQPGSILAYLPGVPEQAKVRLRLTQDTDTWSSDYSSPVGRIELIRR